MLSNPRKIIISLGLALLLFGGFGAWRALHPPLSPEQQVRAEIEDAAQAIQNHNPRAVMSHLAKSFTWNGTSRDDVRQGLNSLVLWRDVQLTLSNLQVKVQDESATTTGNFTITLRQTPDAPVETKKGRFQLEWQQSNGRWEIVKASGGENVVG